MSSEIDENLYSRQLYVFGKNAMLELSRKKILISGINGLGLEVAKNIILSGVNQVTLHDSELLTTMDLSSFFYAEINDVGKNRAELCLNNLSMLNEYVKVDVLTEFLSETILSEYDVVVLCDAKSNSRIVEINGWCRNVGAKFIMANARGLFGVVFCDFGDTFVVTDLTGNAPQPLEILSIEKSKEGLAYVTGDKGHGLCDESLVVFSGLQGMEELNDQEPILIQVKDYLSFYVGNTEKYGGHVKKTGFVREIILPRTLNFKPYGYFIENLPDHECVINNDYTKILHWPTLHLCFITLNDYYEKNGKFPQSWNGYEAQEFLELVKENSKRFSVEIKYHEIIEIFSFIARGNLNPMHASLGGIVAQEALKASTHQFVPITQWYYNDYIECLPENFMSIVNSSIYQSNGTRYDGQIAIFGSDFQKQLENLKYFVIGAGAIGCELLKNFAMIGIGSGDLGKIVVTDMDFIERSNLNRQFLFRNLDIGKSKSHTAAQVVKQMNPYIHIESHENRLGPETEDFYNNSFYQSLNCVVNALDNVEARQYAASRIEFNMCPMIDSGTLGPQASQQVIIPHVTKSYKALRVPDNAFPICTLKHFPYQIEHTIQWAKDLFTSYFTNTPKLVNTFTENRTEFFKTIDKSSTAYQKFDIVKQVLRFLKCIPKSFDDCVKWSLDEWFTHFSKNIQQVLHNFPADYKTVEGLLFWSGTKRTPRFEEFSVEKSYHMDFVIAAAKLRARVFNIDLKPDQYTKSMSKSYLFPKFVPSSDVKIAVDDSEIDKVLDLKVLALRIEELRNLEFNEVLHLYPQDFEKDDDSNFHIDFITSASNMRAFNYCIEPVDRFKTKKIAGKIIPAIATTTSVISGQVCLELFKLAQGHQDIKKFRDSFLNLASPLFTMTIPEQAVKYCVLGKVYSLWDTFDVTGDMTLKEFLVFMKFLTGKLKQDLSKLNASDSDCSVFKHNKESSQEHNLDVTCVTYKKGVIFAQWIDAKYLEDSYGRRIRDIIENKIHQDICKSEIIIPLHISVEDENGDDIEGIPVVRYRL